MDLFDMMLLRMLFASLEEEEDTDSDSDDSDVEEDEDRDAAAVERYSPKQLRKNEEESSLLREHGNAAFSRGDQREAMRKYNRSIATAPYDKNTTGLALAFANRSALHFSLGNYEDCLSDIEQAIKVDYPSHLIYKVLKRRAECHRAMGNMEAARRNFEEAIACCLEEYKKRSMKQELAALKPPEQVYKPRLRVRPPPEKYLGDNPMIPGASACIEIKFNKKYGRHLVATKDIPPGVFLIVEEPFGSVLHPDKCDDYCFRCMRRCRAMIPCKSCAIAMFCSEACRELSQTESHDLECAVLMKLIAADSPTQCMIVLRFFIVSLKKHGNLQQLYDYVTQLDTEVIDGIKGCDEEGRFDGTDLRAFYNLAQRNLTKEMSVEYAKRCEFLVNCIDKHSQLFDGLDKSQKRQMGEGPFMKLMKINGLNAFRVQDWATEEADEIGSATYSICSLINHHCIANAAQYQRDKTNIVFTILPIAKGEQVFISYHGEKLDPARVKAARLKVEAGYGFKCDCRRCINPQPENMVLPLCPRCRTPVHATPKMVKVKCLKCYNRFYVRDILKDAKRLMMDVTRLFMRPPNVANVPEISKIITKLHRIVELPDNMLLGLQGLLQSTIIQNGLYYIN